MVSIIRLIFLSFWIETSIFMIITNLFCPFPQTTLLDRGMNLFITIIPPIYVVRNIYIIKEEYNSTPKVS